MAGQLYQSDIDGISVADWLDAYEVSVLQVASYAEIWSGMDPNAPSENIKVVGPLNIISGSIVVDRNNALRRNVSSLVLLADTAGQLLPVANTKDGFYAPYGYEVKLYKGYKIPGAVGVYATLTGAPVTVPLTITSGVNDTFVYTPAATGMPITFLIDPGTYALVGDASFAMQNAKSVYGTILFSTYCTVNPSGSSIEITSLIPTANQNGDEFTTGAPEDALADLGFTSGSTLTGGVSDMAVAQEGTFLIEEVDVNNDGTGLTMTGTLQDRGDWIARRGFWEPFGINTAGGTETADECIADILTFVVTPPSGVFSAFPFATNFTSTTYIPAQQTFDISDDPWKACQDLANEAGMQLYFDYDGTLVLEPIPDPNSVSPCVAYVEGTTIAPVALKRAIANQTVPNVICVKSQGSGVTAPFQAWWWDSNSANVTYYAPAPVPYGFDPTHPTTSLPAPDYPAAKYPHLIQTYDTNTLGNTTQPAQAQALAIAIGLTSIGSLEKSTFTIRDQPAHDIDDVIVVQRVVAGIPASTQYILDTVQIDLTVQNPVVVTGRLVT